MRGLYKLTVIELKLYLREWEVIFWSFLFPIFILLFLNTLFGQRYPKYTEFLFSGLIGVIIMSRTFFGLGVVIASYRTEKILKRFRITPLKGRVFIIAQIFSQYIGTFLSILLLLVIASAIYRIEVKGGYFSLIVVVTIGILSFSTIGFILASIAKTPRSAMAMAQALFIPMMFISGAYFPVTIMPKFLQLVAKILPATYLIRAVRNVVSGAGLRDNSIELLILLTWMVVGFVISVRIFKWE